MAKRPNDDLFEASTMSFGEHLEELRTTLVRAMIGLMIGFGIGLAFANPIVGIIQEPLKKSLTAYYEDKAKEDLIEEYRSKEQETPPEMLQMIEEHGLVPEFIRIEPSGVIEALRVGDPDRFGDLQYREHRYFTSDLKPRALAGEDGIEPFGRAFEEAAKNNPAAKLMWDELTPEDRQRLQQLGKKNELDDQEVKEIVEILNTLAGNSKLHASDAFGQIKIQSRQQFDLWSPATWTMTDPSVEPRQHTVDVLRERVNKNPDPLLTRRLNKLLIAEVFPDHLYRPQKKFVQLPIWKPTEIRVQSLGAHEAFMIWLKAGFVSGLVFASPWIFWQVWAFVAAGLYPHERKYVHVFLPISLGLFLGGVGLAFTFVFEPVLAFLFSFNKAMEIDPDPRISEWMSFVLFLPLGFGVAFQLPLVMLFINRLGILSEEMFLKNWRIAILVIFVISMLLTPADPISMLLMAVPLTVLYFLGIGMCRWMPRFGNPFAEEGVDPV